VPDTATLDELQTQLTSHKQDLLDKLEMVSQLAKRAENAVRQKANERSEAEVQRDLKIARASREKEQQINQAVALTDRDMQLIELGHQMARQQAEHKAQQQADANQSAQRLAEIQRATEHVKIRWAVISAVITAVITAVGTVTVAMITRSEPPRPVPPPPSAAASSAPPMPCSSASCPSPTVSTKPCESIARRCWLDKQKYPEMAPAIASNADRLCRDRTTPGTVSLGGSLKYQCICK